MPENIGKDIKELLTKLGTSESLQNLSKISEGLHNGGINPPDHRVLFPPPDHKLEHAREAERERKRDSDSLIQEIKKLIETTEDQIIMTEELIVTTNKQGRSSSKFSKLSLAFSILAVILAGTAVLFSVLDFKGDATWQTNQLKVLNEIKKSINK